MDEIKKANVVGQNRISRNTAWFLMLLSAVLAILAVGVFVREMRDPSRPDLGVLTVVVFTSLGIVTAAATFGILKSYGVIKGRQEPSSWEFRGPVAVVILFFLAGIYLILVPNPIFQTLVDFKEGEQPLLMSGTFTLWSGGTLQPLTAPIYEGRAALDLPSLERGKIRSYRADIDGYVVDKPKTIGSRPEDWEKS